MTKSSATRNLIPTYVHGIKVYESGIEVYFD